MPSNSSNTLHDPLNLCHVSSFSAENAMITVIPAFHFDSNLPLLSSPFQQSTGPFVAGMPTQVPLWTAKLLHQRQLAQIQLPDWLNTENLSNLLQQEKESTVLTTTLPYHYYEIARSLAKSLEKSTQIVLQDLVAIRVDKIRQHFHDLSRGDLSQGEMHMITVTGMGSVELNKIGPILRQAFSDYGFLIRKSKDEQQQQLDEHDGTTMGDKALQASQKAAASRSKLRRFRAEPAAHKE